MKLIELIMRLLGRKKIDLADYPRPGLWEGTPADKLKQVANYIAANCKYKTGSNDPLALFGEGGMCGAYSMLFYKMATRLGIPAYICYGYASNGVYTGAHAWNRVDLEDGPRYYDITFYDSGCRSGKWLGSRDGWGREHCLNDKSALQKRG